jgi:alkaline phosphatase
VNKKSLVCLIVAATCTLALAGQAFAAKNIILMIGDGMGYQHVNAGSYYLTGAAGNLSFEQYYKCGVKTYSANSSVTDSAAAATALATGNKVNNGVISQASNGTAYPSILENAKALGKRTGSQVLPGNHILCYL